MANVSLKNVKKVYPGNVTAIKGVSLDIADGEFVVLVGPSGCGKSTLAELITGTPKPLLHYQSGDILIDNFKTQRYVSLFNLPKSMRYNFFEKDVRCRSIKNLFSEADIIIHLLKITA